MDREETFPYTNKTKVYGGSPILNLVSGIVELVHRKQSISTTQSPLFDLEVIALTRKEGTLPLSLLLSIQSIILLVLKGS